MSELMLACKKLGIWFLRLYSAINRLSADPAIVLIDSSIRNDQGFPFLIDLK